MIETKIQIVEDDNNKKCLRVVVVDKNGDESIEYFEFNELISFIIDNSQNEMMVFDLGENDNPEFMNPIEYRIMRLKAVDFSYSNISFLLNMDYKTVRAIHKKKENEILTVIRHNLKVKEEKKEDK